jgi:hypothetical protein
MSRPVEMRVSYCDDAAYLLRLEKAVTKDERQPVAWRNNTAKMVRRLSLQLLNAEVGDSAESQVGTALPVKGPATPKRNRRATKASLSSTAL